MSFDPKALAEASSAAPKVNTPKKVFERVIVKVENYDTPAEGFHFAEGVNVATGEKVRVRLNTVDERFEDRPKQDREKIEALYVTGKNTRDKIKDKAADKIDVLAFDDSVLLGEKDGVKEYRSHWDKTVAATPATEVIKADHAHVHLVNSDTGRSLAYVEVVKGAVTLTKDNARAALEKVMSITDDKGGVKPFSMLKIEFGGQPALPDLPRIYPANVVSSVFDQDLGKNKDIKKQVDGDLTAATLMDASRVGVSDFENRQLDVFRAAIAGLEGQDLPKFNSTDQRVLQMVTQIYHGASDGKLDIKLVAAEQINFGAASALSYLKESDRPHMAGYNIETKNEAGDKVTRSAGFAETVIAIQRYEDGTPYVTFASPVDMYPKAEKITACEFKDITADLGLEIKQEIEEPKPAEVTAEEEQDLAM